MSPGATAHPAFEHCRSREISTLQLTVHEFRHRGTGAMHYHLASPHDENVFMVAFRTVPMNSTGVAHVLEHTALCGSERFPVRDPFFLMLRRSLNTFMNAFTTNDYTAYPFASQNRKDFFNLLDIYLDSVFFPKLDELDFAQEGHRLEFEDPIDPATDLVHRGVVYNEMKGDSSSVVSVLYEKLQETLFPTTTYHFNSGGDPEHIPDLKYDDLLAFHRSHYHPSNAIFMTFGSLEPGELQAEFEEKALFRFNRLDTEISVTPEIRYSEPQRVDAPYAPQNPSDLKRQTHVVTGWLLGPNTDLEMLLKGHLLSDVLLDTSASPLRRALEETTLGTAVSPLCGLEEGNHEMTFMCGVEGSEPVHADAVETLILSTLEQVAAEGVAFDRLEAVLHQLELHQREVGGDGLPYGLQLISSCMAAAVHRGDPIDLLDLDPILERLRQQIRDPAFIRNLVRELLIDNPHRVRLTFYPDPTLDEKKQARERARLSSIKSDLSETRKQELVARAKALQERQTREENLDVLPKVGLEDIPLDIRLPEGKVRETGSGARLTSYSAGTNGLVYHQVVTGLPAIDSALLPCLPLYTQIVSEVGTTEHDYLETQHLQHGATGGINVFTSVRPTVGQTDALIGHLTFSTRTLNRKCDEMVRLLKETSLLARFDELTRIRELMSQIRARRQAGITNNGHTYAMSAAAARFRPISWLNHQLSGLAGLRRLMELDSRLDSPAELASFAAQLQALHELLRAAPRQFLVIADDAFLEEAVDSVAMTWAAEPGQAAGSPFDFQAGEVPLDQAWPIATQVNFCAMAWPTVAETHPDSAALTVLAAILRNGYLHSAIREKGGAYGAGAGHDTFSAVLRFYSYRDPNIMRTFDAFRESIEWVKAGNAGPSQVEEAILGVIGAMDAPSSPAGEARQAFHNQLFGRDSELRRRSRRAILDVTPEDIRRVAEIYLAGEGSRAVVMNESRRKELPGSFEFNAITE